MYYKSIIAENKKSVLEIAIYCLLVIMHTAEFWITHNGNDRSHYDGKQGTIISEAESHLTS